MQASLSMSSKGMRDSPGHAIVLGWFPAQPHLKPFGECWGLLSWLPLGNLPLPRKKKVFPFGLTSCNSGRGTIVSEGLPCGARRGGRSILSAPGTFEQVARNLFWCAGTRLPGSASFAFVTLRMPQNRTTGSALPGRFQPGAYESKILRSRWRRFEKENSHPPNQRFPATKSQ